MNITGERRISASRRRVWNAITDPQALRACLPGCVMLEAASDRDMRGAIQARFGDADVRLDGTLAFAQSNPPEGGGILVEGKDGRGGAVGAQIGFSLIEEGEATLMRYHATGSVSGPLAERAGAESAGRAWLEAALDQLAADLAAPEAVMADGPAGMAAAIANATADRPNPSALMTALAAIPPEIAGFPIVFWMGGAVFAAIFVLVFGAYL